MLVDFQFSFILDFIGCKFTPSFLNIKAQLCFLHVFFITSTQNKASTFVFIAKQHCKMTARNPVGCMTRADKSKNEQSTLLKDDDWRGAKRTRTRLHAMPAVSGRRIEPYCANECRQAMVITLPHILGFDHFVYTLHFSHISVWLSNVWSVQTTLKIIYTPVYTTTCTITRHARLVTLCTSRFYHAATNKNDYGRPYHLLLQMKRLPRTTVTTNRPHRRL